MKNLSYWLSMWWQVSLSEDTGEFRRKFLLGRATSKKNGWAYKSNGKWFAVYRNDDALMFQCDEWVCKVGDLYQCKLTRELGKSVFILSSGDSVVFRHEYKASSWVKKFDPTYDELDAENDDFLLWLYHLWGDGERVKALTEQLSV